MRPYKVAFPGAGGLVSAGVAVAGTWAIGEAVRACLIEGATMDEAKATVTPVRAQAMESTEDPSVDTE